MNSIVYSNKTKQKNFVCLCDICVEVRGQFVEPVFPPRCGLWGLNSGCHVSWPSHLVSPTGAKFNKVTLLLNFFVFYLWQVVLVFCWCYQVSL